MKINHLKTKNSIRKIQSGFAVVEILLIVVIVGAVGGVGYYVVSQNKSKDASNSQTVAPAKTGTISDIEDKNSASLKDELKTEDDAANQETTAANTEASAAQSVGDGYEASF